MEIPNSGLYDDTYVQGLGNKRKAPRKIATSRNLSAMYDTPTDSVPFTATLRKVGKTDRSVATKLDPTTMHNMYNRDGKYFWSNNTDINRRVYSDRQSSTREQYLVYDALRKTSYTVKNPDNSFVARSVIDPAAGSPIRLQNHNGFVGYLQCLTKGSNIGVVNLASAPQNISDNRTVEIASDTAIGRSQNFNFFSNVGTRTLSFTFDVYADYLPEPYDTVLSYCKALEQMQYPTYSSSIVNSPTVRFEYGGIHIIGIPIITCTFDNTIRKGSVDKATVSVQITETEEIVDGKVIL